MTRPSYTLEKWKELAIIHRYRAYNFNLSRANWRAKFEAETNKAASLAEENERLTRELAEVRAAFDAYILAESKRNGWAVLEDKYSLAQP